MENGPKIVLGHTPNMDEVKMFASTLVKAGDIKMKKDLEEYKKAESEEDKQRFLTKIAMAYTIRNVGKLLEKFVKEGVIEDMEADRKIEDIINMNSEHNVENDSHTSENTVKNRYLVDNMDESDVKDSFNIMSEYFEKCMNKLADKFGQDNAVNLMRGFLDACIESYDEAFKEAKKKMAEEKAEEESEDDNVKTVDAKKAVKEMRENGMEDAADALEKLMKENDNAEIKVFKIKTKNKD